MALEAVKDYVLSLEKVEFPEDINLRLDEFLSNLHNYEHLMVPHEWQSGFSKMIFYTLGV